MKSINRVALATFLMNNFGGPSSAVNIGTGRKIKKQARTKEEQKERIQKARIKRQRKQNELMLNHHFVMSSDPTYSQKKYHQH